MILERYPVKSVEYFSRDLMIGLSTEVPVTSASDVLLTKQDVVHASFERNLQSINPFALTVLLSQTSLIS